MLAFKAFNKYVDIRSSLKLFYLIAVVAFLSVLTFVVYQNIVVTVTVVVCGIAVYIVLAGPKRLIDVEIDDEKISLDSEQIPWSQAIAWAMVDLGDSLEFIVQTNGFAKDFYYFYLDPQTVDVREVIRQLSLYLPYDEVIAGLNRSHNLLRAVGMK
jgi:hypothetical protein